MSTRTYLNFDLSFEAREDGSFRARLTNAPIEDRPAVLFSLPLNDPHLEILLLKLDPGRRGIRRAGQDAAAQAAEELGGLLYDAVFSTDLLVAWSRADDMARSRDAGLRLRLQLGDAPVLAGLPWELLYDRRGNHYIALSERTPVVRYLEVAHPPVPKVVEGALHVLAVIASPSDLPELDVDGEWRRMKAALKPKIDDGTVRLDRLPKPIIAELSSWLRHHDVHVLHFIGHGDYDPQAQDGILYFTDAHERQFPVGPSILGPYLRDHDPLRLVVLNACQSARADATDPFGGMAQGLVQQHCTAVVAMQFPVSDEAATAFSSEFYGALADGLPVDQATTAARKSLLAQRSVEWATPVLFLRSPDGLVFDTVAPASSPLGQSRDTAPDRAHAASSATAAGSARARRVAMALALLLVIFVGVAYWYASGRPQDEVPVAHAAPSLSPTTVVPSTTGPAPTSNNSSSPSSSVTTSSAGTTRAPQATVVAVGTVTVADANLGGLWSRRDRDAEGALPTHESRPANAGDWYPNGSRLTIVCATRGATYPVHYADGHTESWRTWLRIADGTWVPSAAAKEIHVDGLNSYPAC
jgi:hypothetical protein